jgi:hypothetical protein
MPTPVDITGQVFGKLTALEPTGKTDNRRYVIWKFRCECGDVVEKSAGYVMQTARRKDVRTVACGKVSCSIRQHLPGDAAAFNKVHRQYFDNARKRGYAFQLTKEQTRSLFTSPCFYCSAEPSSIMYPSRSQQPPFTYNGIDRLHNELGYVDGNVVACCWMCNRAKGDFTYEEFMEWINRIVQNHL